MFIKSKTGTKILTKPTTFALILLLASCILISITIEVQAQNKIATVAKIAIAPKVTGLGEFVVISAWVTPVPPIPGAVYEDFYVKFTKPDGSQDVKGPFETYDSGTMWFEYVPDSIGEWSAIMTWAGDSTHEACESNRYSFTVQSQPPPEWPTAELPNGYWERPISAENREWSQIGGSWANTGRAERDTAGSDFNPFSRAPDSGHILWKNEPKITGIIGGEYGDISYGAAPSSVIVAGRVYFISSDGLHCLDINTGEELWVTAGASGTILAQVGPTPYIWTAGTTSFKRYDASTGALTKTFTGPGLPIGRIVIDNQGFFYLALRPSSGANTNLFRGLIKWNGNGASTNFTDNIVWQVKPDNKTGENNISNIYVWQDVLVHFPNGGRWTWAYNATSGKKMWEIDQKYTMEGAASLTNGIVCMTSSDDRRAHGFDIYTGIEVWQSDQAEDPWGSFWAYNYAAAYSKFYILCYDGYVYSLDANTGKTVWKFYSGDTSETPYNTWPFYSNPAVADGKIYVSTTEHSPTEPLQRGRKLYCLDAEKGTLYWSISMSGGQKAIADDKLVLSGDEYTGLTFCFGKGQTATTVSASPKIASKGSSVLLEGSVVDLSSAQSGTPAISDESMSAWMEFLHMQKPKPTTTGVPVTLLAIDEAGSTQNIAQVVSDGNGLFSMMWTPPTAGKYTIIASFEGTNSYFGSNGETAIGVSIAATSSTPDSVKTVNQVSAEVFYVFAAIVVALIVVVAVLILRKK